jgi:hypothetical protein
VVTKNHVKQVKWNQFIKTEGNLGYVRNGNVLKIRVSEICVKRVRSKEYIDRRHGEPFKFLFLPKMGLLGSQAVLEKKVQF